jgi:hypothetical protein
VNWAEPRGVSGDIRRNDAPRNTQTGLLALAHFAIAATQIHLTAPNWDAPQNASANAKRRSCTAPPLAAKLLSDSAVTGQRRRRHHLP